MTIDVSPGVALLTGLVVGAFVGLTPWVIATVVIALLAAALNTYAS